MIINRTTLDAGKIDSNYCMEIDGERDIFANAIYLDLEHFIFRVPLCIGVFGTCYYDAENNTVEAVQYMMQSRKDAEEILHIAYEYFMKKDFRYIITFAGENDFLVLNHLFKKHKIKFDFPDNYKLVDLQKQYHKDTGNMIGLKNLEKVFEIDREGEVVSGSNIARTFSKIYRTPGYGERLDKDKANRILQYNLEDVVDLFYITTNWKKYITPSVK